MDPLLLIVLPLIGGYVLDLALGDPETWPHPVVGFGRAISAGERRLNHGDAHRRFWLGAAMTGVLVAGAWAATAVAVGGAAALHPWAGVGVATIIVFQGLAHRTLIREGRAVFSALEADLTLGRRRLSRIVGRDTGALGPQEVRTAVFETMAENLSDGVVAPLFYYVLGGQAGMMAYKMVNTLDSMIGHRDARCEWFGKAAARLDDLANYLPARLTALLMITVSASGRAWRFCWKYGRAHASPNAGYPEAALAGLLDLRFGGPLWYDGERVEKPFIGEQERVIAPHEIETVVRLNHRVALAAVLLSGAGGVALSG